MASTPASPDDRHANRQRSRVLRVFRQATATGLWLRAVLLGVALTIATAQVIGAGMLPPQVEIGGTGAGSAPADGVLDETDRSLTLIELGQGSDSVTVPYDAFDGQAAMEWAGGDSARKVFLSPQIEEYVMCVPCFTLV